MKNQLPVHEWLAVFIFIAILLTFGSLSLLRRDPQLPTPMNTIHVRVTGEVENPGFHALPPGSTIHDLCHHVFPKTYTEPVNLSYNDTLKDGQTIRFKSSLVRVHIKGAVEKPQILKLKLGTELIEAQDQIKLTPDANFSKVQNRVIKRNNQVITVPKIRK